MPVFPATTLVLTVSPEQAERNLAEYLMSSNGELRGRVSSRVFRVWRRHHNGVTFVIDGEILPAGGGAEAPVESRINVGGMLLLVGGGALGLASGIGGLASANLQLFISSLGVFGVLGVGLLLHRSSANKALDRLAEILSGRA